MRSGLGKILIRADASVEMGTGHVMRCLALAQAWQDEGGDVIFAMAESTPAVLARLADERRDAIPMQVVAGSSRDACRTIEIAQKHRARWIVADGHSFGASYQSSIKAAGLNLLCVDENAEAAHFFADLVLNQNLHANESFYQARESTTKLLLGPKFALLRREFRKWRGWRRHIPPVAQRLLVTTGGSDPRNLSALVIDALRHQKIEGLEVKVLAGGSNPRIESLRVGETRGVYKLEVDAYNIPELMAWADFAVSSAGSTCWEFCMLELPAIVIDAAGNQTALAQEIDRRGIALHLPLAKVTIHAVAEKIELLANSSDLRSSMSRRAAELVDGRGGERVVAAIRTHGVGHLPQVLESGTPLAWDLVKE
jgi:UDP-2,4-diacetamido-2,4,6-trideoxy-beta-L-altropyranose hydrolase